MSMSQLRVEECASLERTFVFGDDAKYTLNNGADYKRGVIDPTAEDLNEVAFTLTAEAIEREEDYKSALEWTRRKLHYVGAMMVGGAFGGAVTGIAYANYAHAQDSHPLLKATGIGLVVANVVANIIYTVSSTDADRDLAKFTRRLKATKDRQKILLDYTNSNVT